MYKFALTKIYIVLAPMFFKKMKSEPIEASFKPLGNAFVITGFLLLKKFKNNAPYFHSFFYIRPGSESGSSKSSNFFTHKW